MLHSVLASAREFIESMQLVCLLISRKGRRDPF